MTREKLPPGRYGFTPSDIRAAAGRISSLAVRTPLLPSPELDRCAGGSVCMKLENLQPTGSFKVRGAAHMILGLSAAERNRGLIAVSSGNHGAAVSYVAGRLGLEALICLPATVPDHKAERIRSLGARVLVAGSTYDAADEHAARLRRERGLTYVPPFDHPRILAGQGTIGLELLEDRPDLDTVIVPVSGGGLIGGIALALKSARRSIRVVGAMMRRAPVMHASVQAGRIVRLTEEPTLADALAGGLGAHNRYTFRLCRELVDEIVLVSEEEIAAAMCFLFETHRLVIEGGGAVGVAALLTRRAACGGATAVVLSGGNVDLSVLLDITRRRRGVGAGRH